MLSGSERETIKEWTRVARNWLILLAVIVNAVIIVVAITGWMTPACATQTGCRTTTIFEPGGRITICTTCCNVFGNCTVSCH